jgi:hypothetical protein
LLHHVICNSCNASADRLVLRGISCHTSPFEARPRVCLCDTERQRRLQPKIQLKSCGKLTALPTGNATALKDFISCKIISVIVTKFFWFFSQCGCGIAFRRFGGTYRLHLQVYEFLNSLATLGMKAVVSSKFREEVIQSHSVVTQKTRFLNGLLVENSDRLCIAKNMFISDYFRFLIYCLLVHDSSFM